MLHFSCDLCGKELSEGDGRFVVKIEVFAAPAGGTITEADLDADNLETVAQLLEEAETDPDLPAVQPATQHYRFDLCPECRKRY